MSAINAQTLYNFMYGGLWGRLWAVDTGFSSTHQAVVQGGIGKGDLLFY